MNVLTSHVESSGHFSKKAQGSRLSKDEWGIVAFTTYGELISSIGVVAAVVGTDKIPVLNNGRDWLATKAAGLIHQSMHMMGHERDIADIKEKVEFPIKFAIGAAVGGLLHFGTQPLLESKVGGVSNSFEKILSAKVKAAVGLAAIVVVLENGPLKDKYEQLVERISVLFDKKIYGASAKPEAENHVASKEARDLTRIAGVDLALTSLAVAMASASRIYDDRRNR